MALVLPHLSSGITTRRLRPTSNACPVTNIAPGKVPSHAIGIGARAQECSNPAAACAAEHGLLRRRGRMSIRCQSGGPWLASAAGAFAWIWNLPLQTGQALGEENSSPLLIGADAFNVDWAVTVIINIAVYLFLWHALKFLFFTPFDDDDLAKFEAEEKRQQEQEERDLELPPEYADYLTASVRSVVSTGPSLSERVSLADVSALSQKAAEGLAVLIRSARGTAALVLLNRQVTGKRLEPGCSLPIKANLFIEMENMLDAMGENVYNNKAQEGFVLATLANMFADVATVYVVENLVASAARLKIAASEPSFKWL